ncbi:cyclin-P3-1 [Vitis vinifera]|nr:cyclin-P3-1 [Vitis vinifera]|eukprot:XP_002280845.2 PREDICTED: cyclin-P3-1 [Vitis vinifera]
MPLPASPTKKTITMETQQPPEDNHEAARIYAALGLVESRKRAEKPPRALFLIAASLRRSIRKNEKFIQTSTRKTTPTITDFHSSRAPSLTVQQYMERIDKYANCSPSCYVVAFLYINRYLKRVGVRLTSLNVHRLLITAVMLAAKFMDDMFYDNAFYAVIGGLSIKEMNSLEVKLLFDMDFRLHVTVETFRRCCVKLEEEAASGGNHGVNESQAASTISGYTCRSI